jgi:3-oxoacyl-[acyl-carrier protein] reductase
LHKIGIITGAGSGVGKATALACAREGADVVILDLPPGIAAATTHEVWGLGRQGLAVSRGVTNAADVDRPIEATLRAFSSYVTGVTLPVEGGFLAYGS